MISTTILDSKEIKMKAVFIDIDGTLLTSNKTITEKTINTLKRLKEKGILCVITTGRPRWKTKDIAIKSGASPYIISTNGSDIFNCENNEVIYQKRMNKKALIDLYKLGTNNDVLVKFQSGFDIYVNKKLKPSHSYRKLFPNDMEKFLNENTITQVLFESYDFEKIKTLKTQLEKLKQIKIVNQTKSLVYPEVKLEQNQFTYLDINSPDVNKGNAIKIFCEKFNIDLKDTICIGDELNDIPMFKITGKSVVMGNARDDVKSFANVITTTNDEDGVATFLENEFLKN